MVKSKRSLAHEAFIPRVLNVRDFSASYMEWYVLQALSYGELQCGKSELCSQVPPEPRLFFAMFQWVIWAPWLNIPVLSLQSLNR